MRLNLFFLTFFTIVLFSNALTAQHLEVAKGIKAPMEQLQKDFPMEKVPPIKGHKVVVNESSLNTLDVCYKAKFTPEMAALAKEYANYFAKENARELSVIKGFQQLYEEDIEQGLGKKALPNCLKYLPMALAANNRRFVNDNGRVGLWQLTYPVAVKYGLVVTQDIDERRDVKRSTEVAARYFKDLYDLFGTHDMALMAFTCGPAAVNKAVIRSNGKRDYASLYALLPEASRDYILAYTVLLYLCEYEGKDKVPVYEILKGEEAEVVQVKERVAMNLITKNVGIKENLIKAMNPMYRSEYVPISSTYPLHVPKGYKEKFEAVEDSLYALQNRLDKPKPKPVYVPPKPKPIPKASIPEDAKKIIYTVKAGDNLSYISQQYNVSVNQLKGWNGLSSDRIDIGQKLTVYVNGYDPNPVPKEKETPKPVLSGDWTTYTVKSGDTLWSISRKYGCTTDELMKWNGIGENIDVGQVLKIKK